MVMRCLIFVFLFLLGANAFAVNYTWDSGYTGTCNGLSSPSAVASCEAAYLGTSFGVPPFSVTSIVVTGVYATITLHDNTYNFDQVTTAHRNGDSCPAGASPDGDGQCICTLPAVMNGAGTACIAPDGTPPCDSPNTLVNGVCTAPPPTCVAPQVLKNGVCVDPDACAQKAGQTTSKSGQASGGVGTGCSSGNCEVQIHDCFTTQFDSAGNPKPGTFNCAATYTGSVCAAPPPTPDNPSPSAPAPGTGVGGAPDGPAPPKPTGQTGGAEPGGAGDGLGCANGMAKDSAGNCTGVGTGQGAGRGGSGSGDGSGSCDPTTGVCTGSTAEGGYDCHAPPTCTGDAVQCAILIDSWRQICLTAPVDNNEINTALVNGGADPSAQLPQQSINIGDKLSAAGVFSIQSSIPACPAPIALSLHTGNVSVSYQPFCDLASMLRPLVLSIFGFMAFRVFAGAV